MRALRQCLRRARRRRATRGVNGNSCSLPLMPLRLTRPCQEKKWGSGMLSRAHGAELPVAIVRGRGCAGDEYQIGDLAVDPVPLAVEERAPCALAVLHRAPATVGVQRDARAIGLGEHQPGARLRDGPAPFIELAHESRLDRDESRLAAFREAILDGIDERLVDGARDRKSTRLNSSHSQISYAVFCLKKKKKKQANNKSWKTSTPTRRLAITR